MTTNDTNYPNGEHRDEMDAMMDANLRAIGGRIGPVAAPDAATVRSWRTGKVETPAPRLVTGSGDAAEGKVVRVRRSRWLAAGSAIAACVAIGTVMVFQPWGSTVQASTILEGLRSKTFGGVNLRFDHVSSGGTTVDGFIRMRLNAPVSIETLNKPHAIDDKDHFGAAYGKFTITTDERVPGWAGGKIEAEGALTRGSGWMYVQASDRTVGQIAAAEPRAAGIASMAGKGVLLNVGGLDESFFEGLNAMICPAAKARSAGLQASVERDAEGHGRVTLGLGMGSGVRKDSSGSESGTTQPNAEQIQKFASLARLVLSGQARQGELDQMSKMIQDDFSQKASVQKLGGGRYLLTADMPDPERPGNAAPGATLTVCYEEQGGVEWAEIGRMRDSTGTIRVEFVADPIDPALLAYDRLVETGKTNYLDLRTIMRMFMPGASGK